LLAVVGILVAFASGHAAMYVLAAIGPVVMVAGVIPKMRWLRGLWLQGIVDYCPPSRSSGGDIQGRH